MSLLEIAKPRCAAEINAIAAKYHRAAKRRWALAWREERDKGMREPSHPRACILLATANDFLKMAKEARQMERMYARKGGQ